MFAGRYFAPRYFARRYFPAAGADLPLDLPGPSPLLAQVAADFAAITRSPDWLTAWLEDAVMGFARSVVLPGGITTGIWHGACVVSGEWRPPSVLLSVGDAATLAAGDLVTIDGVEYRVAGPALPSALGWSRVVLNLAAGA